MLAALKERWHERLSWAECETLCGEMTALRASIVEQRGIKPPRKFCCNYQACHEMKPLDVSVRAVLFALEIAVAADTSKRVSLDRAWQKEQRRRKRQMAAPALASGATGADGTTCTASW